MYVCLYVFMCAMRVRVYVCMWVCMCVRVWICVMAIARVIRDLVGWVLQGPMSPTAVEFVVRFLGYAVKSQRFGGISWRVDDVLAPILGKC